VLVITSALPLSPIGTAVAAQDGCGDIQTSEVMMGFIGILDNAADCLGGSGSVPEQLNTTDARETKTQVYGALSSVRETQRAANDTRTNTLEMSRAIARMEAKNAYIRALDNGSTETEARLAAHEAVDEFYSPMEAQVITQWNIRLAELERATNATVNATDVSDSYISAKLRNTDTESYTFQTLIFEQGDYTLANGTTVTSTVLKATWDWSGGSAPIYFYTNGYKWGEGDNDSSGARFDHIYVDKPYADYSGDGMTYLDIEDNPYADQLQAIQAQEEQVDANVNTFVNNTYDAWEAGRINSSDLVDPYLAAREYGPEDGYQTWALRSLMSMGQASPQNLSEFGQMNVTDLATGQTHRGILLSDGLPESGSFTVGTTYDATNLSGPQYVITGSETVELDGQFRVDSATNDSGATVNTVEYNRVRYQTSNISEYKQQVQDLQVALAETEARQQRLRNQLNGGVGFGGLFGGGSINQTIALLVIAALAGAALLN